MAWEAVRRKKAPASYWKWWTVPHCGFGHLFLQSLRVRNNKKQIIGARKVIILIVNTNKSLGQEHPEERSSAVTACQTQWTSYSRLSKTLWHLTPFIKGTWDLDCHAEGVLWNGYLLHIIVYKYTLRCEGNIVWQIVSAWQQQCFLSHKEKPMRPQPSPSQATRWSCPHKICSTYWLCT